jgi:hypothetical protein
MIDVKSPSELPRPPIIKIKPRFETWPGCIDRAFDAAQCREVIKVDRILRHNVARFTAAIASATG